MLLKNYRKFSYWILFLLIIGCTDPSNELQKKTDFTEMTSVDRDPTLKKLITELYPTGKPSQSGRAMQTDFGIIQEDKVIKLNDSIYNRTRYSLILNSQSDSLTFENLILVIREEGIFHYILQYKPDPRWLGKNIKNLNWSTFTGSIRQLDIDRNIKAEAYLVNGVYIPSTKNSGRTQDCYSCTWRVSDVGATFGQTLDIDCGAGGGYLYYFRTQCGGGGGDGGGSYGGDSGGYTGGGDNGYGSTGGYSGDGSTGGGSGDPGYYNPIAVNGPGEAQYKLCNNDYAIPVNDICPDEFVSTNPDVYWDYCIRVQLNSPCLNSVANRTLDVNLVSKYNSLIQDIFGKNDRVNLILRDDKALSSTTLGETEPPVTTNGIINITSYLNANLLDVTTAEYAASTVYHEVFHAIVNYLDYNDWIKNSATDDHIAMFTRYLDLLADSLRAAYPNLSTRDSQGLILKGILPYKTKWGTSYGKILAKKQFTETEINEIQLRYINRTSGTPCP